MRLLLMIGDVGPPFSLISANVARFHAVRIMNSFVMLLEVAQGSGFVVTLRALMEDLAVLAFEVGSHAALGRGLEVAFLALH